VAARNSLDCDIFIHSFEAPALRVRLHLLPILGSRSGALASATAPAYDSPAIIHNYEFKTRSSSAALLGRRVIHC
jgi:hypothetical protein